MQGPRPPHLQRRPFSALLQLAVKALCLRHHVRRGDGRRPPFISDADAQLAGLSELDVRQQPPAQARYSHAVPQRRNAQLEPELGQLQDWSASERHRA